MSKTAFVLGNGESRRGIKIADLKQHGTVWACNGVYRTENPDFLVAVDPKMILEIAESDYIKHNQVWSNYNAQYEKNDIVKNHVQWFQPSLGWSSGPTALRRACERKFKKIYILGFDYQGHIDAHKKNRHKLNNIFKDTRNYKKSKDEATFYGNWMNQTKRCLQDFPDTKFIRVTPQGWFRPKDLEWNGNLSSMDVEDFLVQFKLTLKMA